MRRAYLAIIYNYHRTMNVWRQLQNMTQQFIVTFSKLNHFTMFADWIPGCDACVLFYTGTVNHNAKKISYENIYNMIWPDNM